jgi:hypothetical protein
VVVVVSTKPAVLSEMATNDPSCSGTNNTNRSSSISWRPSHPPLCNHQQQQLLQQTLVEEGTLLPLGRGYDINSTATYDNVAAIRSSMLL